MMWLLREIVFFEFDMLKLWIYRSLHTPPRYTNSLLDFTENEIRTRGKERIKGSRCCVYIFLILAGNQRTDTHTDQVYTVTLWHMRAEG